jgi:ParB-like chromosome segregation protein Spo0J
MKTIKLEDIQIEAGTQARCAIDPTTVDDYAERMEEGDKFPPIIVFHDGSDYFPADGFHRILAAERVGFIEIDAEVRKGTRDDALWFAIGANKTNGRRMTRGDVRRAVELALKTWPDKTQQAVADQVGCSRPYVTRIQEELVTSNKLDPPTTRTGADGRKRPTTYRKRKEEVEDEAEEVSEPEQAKGGNGKKPPCAGLAIARVAVRRLEEIKPNDLERQAAFDYVKEWIRDHEN